MMEVIGEYSKNDDFLCLLAGLHDRFFVENRFGAR